MNCKYCNAELEATDTVCPNCGEAVEQAEAAAPVEAAEVAEAVQPAAEKKPVSIWMIILATAACVLLLVVLVVAVIYGITGKLPYLPDFGAKETTAATEPSEPLDLGMFFDSVTEKASYTADDADVLAAGDTVVATVGDYKLTNGELQVYYWMEVFNFVDENSSYLSAMELDYTQPLEDQKVMGTEVTWQQFFLDGALQTWHRYAVLSILADEVGYTLSEEAKAEIDKLPQTLAEMAAGKGFASAEEMLACDMGAGCTMENYISHITTYQRVMSFFNSLYENTEPTAEQIDAFFEQHAAEYEEANVTKESGNFVDVRHILLTPAADTETESTDPTEQTQGTEATVSEEEQWEACRLAAQAVLDTWLAGEKTEESFAALANEHSTDPGSNTTGGLYSNVYTGQMVEEFDAWCFDESRKEGDYGLVKTSYGYHVMYFIKSQPIWSYYARNDLVSEMCTTLLSDGVEEHPANVEMGSIVLAQAKLSDGSTTDAAGETEGTAGTDATAAADTTAATAGE